MPAFEIPDNTADAELAAAPPRIGLALSGGGFRAALFHLGVIRRLEELGIMQHVSVISSVSGGSIVAAYYVCEMERRLRPYGKEQWHDPAVRVAIFEEIAACFVRQLDQNMRTRAMLYGLFHYPWISIKSGLASLVRAGARSELIQREYDRCFYEERTLGDLPSVTPVRGAEMDSVLYGPKLILNTTSLLTGKRVAFSRITVSGLNQLSCVDANVLPLARVVGASSAVPVLFPPATISGDVLVDGGVSDNQGIEGLLDHPPCDVLLVSDACGQMEAVDSIKTSEVKVALRVNSILQFQVRQKLLHILRDEKRPFAFVHLYLNLKDRGEIARVPSEFIPPLARIRTDLDQFSYIERELLMYHGYTLIDAQIERYNRWLIQNEMPLREPPLMNAHAQQYREAIREELEAGSEGLFLLRSIDKFGWPAGLAAGLGAASGVVLFAALAWWRTPLTALQGSIRTAILGLLPNVVVRWVNLLLTKLNLPDLTATTSGLAALLAVVVMLALSLYVVSYPVFRWMQAYAASKDLERYRLYTGEEPTTQWKAKEEAQRSVGAPAS